MREDFIILSVVGWCWAALVGLFLLIRLKFKTPLPASGFPKSLDEPRP